MPGRPGWRRQSRSRRLPQFQPPALNFTTADSGPQCNPNFRKHRRARNRIHPVLPVLHLLLDASRNLTHFGSFWWFFTFHLSFLTNILHSCVTALALLPVVDAQIAGKRSSCCIPLCLELLSSEWIPDTTHTGF